MSTANILTNLHIASREGRFKAFNWLSKIKKPRNIPAFLFSSIQEESCKLQFRQKLPVIKKTTTVVF